MKYKGYHCVVELNDRCGGVTMMCPNYDDPTFLKLTSPMRDDNGSAMSVTCEYPKTIDVINDVTKILSNQNNGGNAMNTNIFRNMNAYKTYKSFIDTLRKNGANMEISLNGHDGINLDIDIRANTLQILRALETIQPFDIPEIVDYRFYNDKVTVVWFADDSYTKCVVQGEDVFDPDTGIIFCVVKKMLGSNGHEKFNDILKTAHAAHEKVEADKKKAADEKRARKEKNAQLHAKKLAREEKERQKAIDIQKQAYIEAIAEVASTKKPGARKKVTKE